MVKPKKIGSGTVGTVFAPNFPCPGFGTDKQYISKLMWKKKPYRREMKHLDQVLILDPDQELLSTYDETCDVELTFPGDKHTYKYNIIKKHFGNSLNKREYDSHRSYKHIVNVFLKHTLLGLLILHSHGIFHGDIAQRNIVYDKKTNRYRLIDFNGSSSVAEVDRVCNMNVLKQAEQEQRLTSVFDTIAFRGDGGHSCFKFKQWKDVHAMMYDKKHDLRGFQLEGLATSIKNEHQHIDVMYVLHVALSIAKNKKTERKLYNKIENILTKKYIKTRNVWNELFPNIPLPKKFKANEVKHLLYNA